MAIQFVGSKTASKGGATSGNSTVTINTGLTGGIASSASSGDLVIAAFVVGSTADRTLLISDGTNNYTLIGTEQYVDDTSDTNLRVAYKFITSDTSVTFGPTGSDAGAGAMLVMVFRGVDTTTPLGGISVVEVGQQNTALVNPGSITPTDSGSFIVVIGGSAHDAGAETFTSSDLTNFKTTSSTDTGQDVSIGGGYNAWTSGAFDPAAWTFSDTNSTTFSCASTVFVLKEKPTDALTATGITSSGTVGTPALTHIHVLTATGVTSSGTVGTPAITQVHVLTATGITSSPTVDTPVLSAVVALTADGITSSPTVGTPAITQEHALAADGVTSSPTVGTPVLAEVHVLAADGITSSGTVDQPAIGQEHVLAADGLTSTGTVGSPAITQEHTLSADGITSTGTVGSPAITQAHILAADGITSTGTVDQAVFAQVHVLSATGITSSGTVGTPELSSLSNVDVLPPANGITSSGTVGTPALTQEHALAANGLTSTGTVGSPVFGQSHALTATGITVTGEVGSPAIEVRVFVPGGNFGIGAAPDVQVVGDTRWKGVREAREAAAAAFREVVATPVARKKEAAVRASEAISRVAKAVREEPKPAIAPVEGAWDDVLQDLETLQAILAGLMEQKAIRAREAREAAERWAMIERELAIQAQREEELMIVFALAL